MPNHFRLSSTSKYKLPENSSMPMNISQPAQLSNLDSGDLLADERNANQPQCVPHLIGYTGLIDR